MSLADKHLHLCSCNGTMPLDAPALARALELAGTPVVRTMLCQKELAAFEGTLGPVAVNAHVRFGVGPANGGEDVVACVVRDDGARAAQVRRAVSIRKPLRAFGSGE